MKNGFLILILFLSFIFTFIPWYINKKTKNKLRKRWIKISIGITLLIYFAAARWFRDIALITEITSAPSNDFYRSTVLSKSLLLDICPMLYLIISILLISEKNHKIISYIAPTAALCGFLTVIFVPYTEPQASINLWYIFIGTSLNKLYFMLHFIIYVIGAYYYISYHDNKYKDIIYTNIFFLIQLVYTTIMIFALNITHNASGLVNLDWQYGGEFYTIASIVPIPIPYIAIVFHISIVFLISSLVFFKVFLYRKWQKFPQRKQEILLQKI
ncbi:DUF5378 family protein [Mycoplasma sp. 6243]|uniref:DUF5378 family protein n=1 Tax=Mycoplasma sp. 6243 TaxID=3440865 RepID=UPI003EB9FA41